MSTGAGWEHEVADYLREQGYNTKVRQTVGNHEIDVYATRADEVLVVECKDWTQSVSKDPIRTVYNNAKEIGGSPGLAYTSDLTSGSKQLVGEYDIILFPACIIRGEVLTLEDVRIAVQEHSISLPGVTDLTEIGNPIGPFELRSDFAEDIINEARRKSFEATSENRDTVASKIRSLIAESEAPRCVPILRNDLGQIDLFFIQEAEHNALPRQIRKESVPLS